MGIREKERNAFAGRGLSQASWVDSQYEERRGGGEDWLDLPPSTFQQPTCSPLLNVCEEAAHHRWSTIRSLLSTPETPQPVEERQKEKEERRQHHTFPRTANCRDARKELTYSGYTYRYEDTHRETNTGREREREGKMEGNTSGVSRGMWGKGIMRLCTREERGGPVRLRVQSRKDGGPRGEVFRH